MKNSYEIRGDIVSIFVKAKGVVYECLISLNKLDRAKEMTGTWYAKLDYNTLYVYGTTVGKNRKTVKLHRWITFTPKGIDVDHINHSGLDNRDENLRMSTRSENLQNRKGATIRNKSGIRGVYWCNHFKKWKAEVMLNGKRVFNKSFNTLEEAEKAVKEARAKYLTHSWECSQ